LALPPEVAGTGFEHPAKSSGNDGGGGQSGAECGALGAQNAPLDPDLAAVVDAWPKLPGAIKAGILAMVTAGRRGGLTDDRNG
jgi:hypothetical protein